MAEAVNAHTRTMGVSASIKDDPLLSRNPRLFVATASYFFDPGSSLFAFSFLAFRPLTGYLLLNFISGEYSYCVFLRSSIHSCSFTTMHARFSVITLLLAALAGSAVAAPRRIDTSLLVSDPLAPNASLSTD